MIEMMYKIAPYSLILASGIGFYLLILAGYWHNQTKEMRLQKAYSDAAIAYAVKLTGENGFPIMFIFAFGAGRLDDSGLFPGWPEFRKAFVENEMKQYE